jgi:hypothetical protein
MTPWFLGVSADPKAFQLHGLSPCFDAAQEHAELVKAC